MISAARFGACEAPFLPEKRPVSQPSTPLYGALEVKHLFSRILHFLHFLHTSFFVRVRRETGKKSVVRVHHGEGVAIHIDPESCADAREGIGEALTGERIGQAIEP